MRRINGIIMRRINGISQLRLPIVTTTSLFNKVTISYFTSSLTPPPIQPQPQPQLSPLTNSNQTNSIEELNKVNNNSKELEETTKVNGEGGLELGVSWEELGLTSEMTEKLRRNGWWEPNRVQKEVIPRCLEGHDLVVTAETGSGKTLGYLIPTLHKIMNLPTENIPTTKAPLGVILVPSKELVWQVASTIQALYPDEPSLELIFDRTQLKESNLTSKKYLLITTPSTLVPSSQADVKVTFDSLTSVRYVVVDEVDSLFSRTFHSHTQLLISHLQRQSHHPCQFLFFGASLNPSTSKKALRTYLNHQFPKARYLNSQGAHHTVTTLTESFVNVPHAQLDEELPYKAQDIATRLQNHLPSPRHTPHMPSLVLIFLDNAARTTELQTLVTSSLDPNLNIHSLVFHKNLSRQVRESQLKKLKFGDYPADLVVVYTTDLLARGLDFANLDLIIQADFPTSVTSYLHRAGRTARAGRPGTCVTYVTPKDSLLAQPIISIANRTSSPSPSTASPSPTTTGPTSLAHLFSRRRSLNRKLKQIHSPPSP